MEAGGPGRGMKNEAKAAGVLKWVAEVWRGATLRLWRAQQAKSSIIQDPLPGVTGAVGACAAKPGELEGYPLNPTFSSSGWG